MSYLLNRRTHFMEGSEALTQVWLVPSGDSSTLSPERDSDTACSYINTNVVADETTRVEVDVYVQSAYENIFGALRYHTYVGSSWNQSVFAFGNDGTSCYVGYGNQGDGYVSPQLSLGPHKIVIDRNKCYIDGELKHTFQEESFDTMYPVFIGAQNRGGNAWQQSSSFVKLKGFKMSNGGVLLFDCIGVNKDGVGCMYNSVDGSYIYSANRDYDYTTEPIQ